MKRSRLVAILGILRRFLAQPYNGVRRLFSNGARGIWRRIPLSTHNKQKLKSNLFKWLPFIFGWTAAYRDWASANGLYVPGSHLAASSGQRPDFSEEITYVPLLQAKPLENKPVKIICFYLPQFHPIPENNVWWGDGFTEWTNVRPAQPQFEGHYQPHVPGELGYYNLLDTTVQRRQVELAKLYGIEGFCFYFYWFGSKRLLEAPLQNYLRDSTLDLPFCLCWANENWSRRWDGLDSEILIAQQHSSQDDLAFIEHVAQYMRDPRYIRIDGKPLLLVYRPSLLPSAKKTVQRWREWCRKNDLGEIYLAYTQSFESVDPRIYGFDAAIEFPPNNSSPPNITDKVRPLNEKDFRSTVYNWRVFVERSHEYKKPRYALFRSVCPSWDNTARKKNKGTVFLNSSPQGYQEWLSHAITETCNRISNPEERLIFVNAWNEWAEGAHLEPDCRYGYAYLEATRMAQLRVNLSNKKHKVDEKKPIALVVHAYYGDVLDEILKYVTNIKSVSINLYVTTCKDKLQEVKFKLAASGQKFFLLEVENRGRDVLPFLKIMPDVLKERHELIIKVHTKKSLHRTDGHIWRNKLYEGLLTDQAISSALNSMAKNLKLGIIAPLEHIVPISYYWGANAKKVLSIAARLGANQETLSNISFVAGTMFIARIEALLPIFNLGLTDEDFEEEAMQIDGTMAHAVERSIGISAYAAGFTLPKSTGKFAFADAYASRTTTKPGACVKKPETEIL
jgi:lipopolysaccharide biosynthesis protein